ncbi:MAG: DUF1565 domain-containing protein [Kiritimatiellae bacterium]|nr:DUF1565 domain-containing protein [Kiritimatiellia bacterium]
MNETVCESHQKRVLALVLAFVSSLALMGADLYVDAGVTVSGDGSQAAPYQTIQAAVDAAEAGAVIHVAAGTYATGATEDAFKNSSDVSCTMLNRVYIDKSLTICGEDKARTVIMGAHATTPEDSVGLGLGSDAVRCIGINASNVVISNLTITGGATKKPAADNDPNGSGGGIYAADGLSGIYIVDCVVSNNIAHQAAHARYNNDSTRGMTAVRCWFHAGRARLYYPATRGLSHVHCLLTHHAYTNPMVHSGTFVNCTFADNYCRSLGDSADVQAYNCFFADYWYKADHGASYYNCGFPVEQSYVLSPAVTNEHCLFSIGRDQFIAPLMKDYRLHSGANVLNAGDMAYLSALSIPDEYRYVAYDGTVLDRSAATCHLGCCQEPVTPTAGTLRFASIPSAEGASVAYAHKLNHNAYRFNGDADTLIRGDLAYVRAMEWPIVVKVSFETNKWAGLYGFSASGADTVMRYPYLDGTYEIAPPQDPASTLTLTPVEAANVIYVQQSSTAATEDGTEDAPYKDLQTAINSIASGKSIIYCNGGTFSTGGATYENLACRIGFNGKDIRIVGVGGPTNNFIVGGVDTSVAQDVWPYGMGDGATRCLYLGKSSVGSAIQGFTLTGGRTTDGTVNNTGRRGAGAFLSAGSHITDCVVSNNVGYQGVAINGKESGTSSTVYAFRCLVADNRQYTTSGTEGGSGIIRTTRGAFLIIANNNGGHFGSYEYQYFYNCSMYSSLYAGSNIINGNSTNYNSVISFPNASNNRNPLYGGVVQYSGGAHQGASCIKADPLFAAPASGDLRLLPASPVKSYGTFDYSSDYHIFIGRDFYGNPLRFIDGKPLCGAVQAFAPTVVAEGDGISPSGTSVLAPMQSSIEFTATTPRPLIGFEVDGVTQLVEGVAYTLEIPPGALCDEPYSIRAIYDTNWYVSDRDGSDETGTGTAANPKQTLLGALTNAVSGDVVHVAPGTYGSGVFHHSTVVTYGSSPTVGSRAYIPSGVELVSQGSATNTFIVGEDASDPDVNGCGNDAVRGVFMEANARLTGFTVMGGRTGYTSDNNDNSVGGGILARNNTAVVTDCIISNNVAYRGGGGYNGTYNRCRIVCNRLAPNGNGSAVRGHGSGSPSNTGTAVLNNCIVAGNRGGYTMYFVSSDNCTFASDNVNPDGVAVGIVLLRNCHRVCNTLILGDKDTFETVGFSNCVFSAAMATRVGVHANVTTNACLVAATDDELAIDGSYAPAIGSNIAVDAGDASMYDASKLGALDVYGNPRAVNGARMDVGAVEAVWLPVYSQRLGAAVAVTAASPEVELTASGVSMPAGASLEATVGHAGRAGASYTLMASVDAGGTCSVLRDGASATVLPAGANQFMRIVSFADFMNLAFAADGAPVVLSGIAMNRGMAVSFR